MTHLKRLVILAVAFLGFVFASTPWETEAQPPSSCPAVVEVALTELADNCSDLGRNTACYGNFDVDSTFYRTMADGFFTNPADKASLIDIQSISTSPLDLDSQRWGMAVLNAQADVPNTLPGQPITILLMGDASIENRVSPEVAIVSVDPVEVTAKSESIIRLNPGRDGIVAEIVPNDMQLMADAVDPTREWVRILYKGLPTWIARSEMVASAASIDALPVVTPDSLGPMQAFYFTTGIGPIQCQEAPHVVTIRSNEDLVVNLNVNGADIRIGSTINFKTIAEDLVAITVVEGHMEIVDTDNVVEIGFTAIGKLDGEETIVEWLEFREATDEELQIGQVSQSALAAAIDGEIQVAGPLELIHIVVAGETLFGIGMQYQASLPAIVNRNNLDPSGKIYVGQRLVIPNPGSGFVNLPVSGVQTSSGTQTDPIVNTGVLSCTGFQPVAPTDGLAFGINTFYWNGLSGATSYQVVVNNLETGQAAFFPTTGPETNLTASIDNTTVGPGFDFSWSVQALVNGQPACSSGQINIQRESIVIGPTLPPPFTASWSCSGADLVVTFANAQPGENILIEFSWVGSPVVKNGIGPSGSVFHTIGPVAASNGKVTAPQSGQVILSPSPISC